MSKRRIFNLVPLVVVATMSVSGVAQAQEAQLNASEFVQLDAPHGEAEPADDRGVDARSGRHEAEPADGRGADG